MVALRKSVALKILFARRDDDFGLGVPIDFQPRTRATLECGRQSNFKLVGRLKKAPEKRKDLITGGMANDSLRVRPWADR